MEFDIRVVQERVESHRTTGLKPWTTFFDWEEGATPTKGELMDLQDWYRGIVIDASMAGSEYDGLKKIAEQNVQQLESQITRK